jgi:hypothetical protein
MIGAKFGCRLNNLYISMGRTGQHWENIARYPRVKVEATPFFF